jgi:hypothetical protein
MRRNPLTVHRSQSGNTATMAVAARDGALEPMTEHIEVRFLRADSADTDDLLWAHGVLLGTVGRPACVHRRRC